MSEHWTPLPKLSNEALASIGCPRPIQPITAPQRDWLLARARSTVAGLRLVQSEIEAIGISLKDGSITPEQAAGALAALEQVPCYVASILFADGAE